MDYKTGKLLEEIVQVLNEFIGSEFMNKPEKIENIKSFIDNLRDLQVDINRALIESKNN